MIGKLKRSLGTKCPECKNRLQIRVREINALQNGIPVLISEEYVCCSNINCDYEKDIEQKRIRRKEE